MSIEKYRLRAEGVSPHNPRAPQGIVVNFDLSNFTNFKEKDFSAQGAVALEGRFVIEKAVNAGIEIEWLACVAEREKEWIDFAAERFPVAVLSHTELCEIAGYQFHRGELAIGKRPRIASAREFLDELDGLSGLSELAGHRAADSFVAGRGFGGTAKILCLWNISDPSNVGGMIRSAAALGADAVALGPGTADPFYRKAIRASMGNVFSVRLFSVEEKDIALLRGAGITAIAATLSEKAQPLSGLSRQFALFVGNEGYGLPRTVVEACDAEVAIPMAAGVDSLNVGVAAGILMYELFSAAMRE